MSESDEISTAEWQALERQYAKAAQTSSSIISGPAVAFLYPMKKRAKRAGSRGSYISACIVFYEKHLRSKKTLLEEAQEEAFENQLRIFYLERLVRAANVVFDPE